MPQISKNRLVFQNDITKKQTVVNTTKIFGTDGSASLLRHTLRDELGHTESESDLSYGYKELTLPAGADGGFSWRKMGFISGLEGLTC